MSSRPAATFPGEILSLGISIVLFRTQAVAVRALVEGLLAQGAAHVYIIDNSPDSFGAFAGWLPLKRVTTISTGINLGYGRGNNVAIRDSVELHKYHLVCNPDIDVLPGTLTRLYSVLESRPEVGLCMPRVVGDDGEVQHLCKRPPSPLDYLSGVLLPNGWGKRRRARFEMRDRSYDEEMDVEILSGCFMFFRSSVLRELHGFDERFFLYFEDFDLARRASRIARNLYYPGAQIRHGHAREHRRSWRVRRYFLMSAIRYFNKWGWLG